MNATHELCTVTAGRRQELLARVVELYEQDLIESAAAADFLKQHALLSSPVLARCRVGWCAGKLHERLPSNGTVLEELTSLGLLTSDGREAFENCLVLPVLDDGGIIRMLCGVGGNGDNELLAPRVEAAVWQAPGVAAPSERVIGQGILDGLSLLHAGVENAAVLFGDLLAARRCLEERVRWLAPSNAAAPVDPDVENAVLPLPPGIASANALLQKHGITAVQELVLPNAGPSAAEGFPVLCDFRCYRVLGLEQKNRKLAATVRLECNGRLHVDTLDFYQARHRQRLARDLSRVFELDAMTAAADVKQLVLACERALAAPPPVEPESEPAMSPAAEAEAMALAREPDLFECILQDFDACGLVGEEKNKLLCYLALTSRKLAKPLSVLILSSSGAGKTALQDAALAFCPPEDLVKLTRLSGKALFYKDRTSLKHKVLAIEEGAGAGAAAYAIRCLISADALTTESAVRDPGSGRLTTMSNTVEGPTAVFYTTTDPEVDAETRSRFLVTGVDESREQTRRILAAQRQAAVDPSVGSRSETIIARHRDFQRLLRPLTVVNPLAVELEFQDDRLQARRLLPQYLTLVQAVALLRQFQKEVFTDADGRECIEVDDIDVAWAGRVAGEILGRTLDELTIPGRDLLGLLWEMLRRRAGRLNEELAPDADRVEVEDLRFTRKQVRHCIGWSNTRLHTHLHELLDLEYVAVAAVHRGGRQEYRLLYDPDRDGRLDT